MDLSTAHFAQCIATLEASSSALAKTKLASMEFEVYRLAVIKGFELTLELAGKLLRKRLKEFEASPREVDALVFKDIFRLANKHGILESNAVERWFRYRDNRNQTAHDYGQAFTQITLGLLPDFIQDAKALENALRVKTP
jgi:nucleotidyltransferase substrate binding protein (TIGR01987 family)